MLSPFAEELVPLINKLKRKYDYKVAVPADFSARDIGVREVVRMARLSQDVYFCIFITPSLVQEDRVLERQLKEARDYNLKRQGFIMKPAGQDRIVSRRTFQLFTSLDTEVNNAFSTHGQILGCIEFISN